MSDHLPARQTPKTGRSLPEGGGLRVDLRGALAGILALAADGKNPAAVGDGLEQIKLVAGIGFEPMTFRL